MKLRMFMMRVGTVSLCISTLCAPSVRAATIAAPQLVISQFKITSSNGQFITLYNQSDSVIDLSQYEVDYLNSSNKLAGIPVTGQLAPHSYCMLDDDQTKICFQMTMNAVSLGLATTAGTLQLWQLSMDKASKTLQDSVSWASKATSGSVTLPPQNAANTVSLLREPTDNSGNPQIVTPLSGSWQAVSPDAANPCNLDIVNTVTPVPSASSDPGNLLGVGQAPPVTIISLAADSSGTAGPSLPVEDIGLAAPQVTEVLPNPTGTGNDGSDEFIELYNPNAVPFQLAGFTLQAGLTTKHNYTFPATAVLPAHGFTAFYSHETALSLSNTSGQVDLLDPFGNTIAQTDVYTAKDGQAWALANGSWYWKSVVTPGGSNVIKQVVTASKKTVSKKLGIKSKTAGMVKGAATGTAAPDKTVANQADTTPAAPIHPYLLAAVAALAVGYGVYEYRHDLANRVHQFRANRATRRKTGK